MVSAVVDVFPESRAGLPGDLELLIAILENLTIPAFQLVIRSIIPNSAVQTIFVVVTNLLGNLVLGFLL
jgi:hypothetical protein